MIYFVGMKGLIDDEGNYLPENLTELGRICTLNLQVDWSFNPVFRHSCRIQDTVSWHSPGTGCD